MKKVFFNILFIFITLSYSYASNNARLDSLKLVLQQTIPDTTRVYVLLQIGNLYHYIAPDSTLVYCKEALNIIDEKIDTAELSSITPNSIDLKLLTYKANAFIAIGIVYIIQSAYEKGIIYHKKAIEILEHINDEDRIATCYNNMGLIYYYQGNYQQALQTFFKSLEIREKIGNTKDMGTTFLNIGNIYYAQENYSQALVYYQKLYAISKELNDKQSKATSSMNIGVIYNQLEEYEKAMVHFEKALELQVALNDKYGLSHTYANMGELYLRNGENTKAKTYFLKSLKIRKATKDMKGIAFCYNSLSVVYNHLADTMKKHNTQQWRMHIDSALYYGEKAYQLALEIGSVKRQNEAAEMVQSAYKKMGDFERALKFAEIYISTRDSLFSEEKTKALTEMQTKYDTEKKQQQIEMQEIQLFAKDERIKKQNILRNALIIGLVGVIFIIVLVIYAYRQKKKSNEQLKILHDEVSAQKVKIESQRDQVLKQKKQLTDSIDYAAFIQEALLPDENVLSRNFSEHFVFFKPREKIGGDFYWIKEVMDYTIIAVADCTGHGVPGAMLSMLGMSLLNELVRREEVKSPAQLLEYLRLEIKTALKQDKNSRSLKDGMDIAICAVNTKTMQMQYAGANNPLFIFSSGTLHELNPTNNPIGIYLREEKFENHTLKIEKGSILYLFSDGFYDQFGGEENKKFMYPNFKNLLLQNANEPMAKQYEILDSAFSAWKGSGNQIDDVLVLGVKV